MDYNAIKLEIESDPLNLGYAGKTPAEIKQLLTDTMVPSIRNIPLDDLQACLMTVVTGTDPIPVWWMLKNAAKTNQTAEIAFDYFTSRLQSVDTTLPVVQTTIDALEAMGILDPTTKAAVFALTQVNKSRGEVLFGRVPNVLEIQLSMLEG